MAEIGDYMPVKQGQLALTNASSQPAKFSRAKLQPHFEIEDVRLCNERSYSAYPCPDSPTLTNQEKARVVRLLQTVLTNLI